MCIFIGVVLININHTPKLSGQDDGYNLAAEFHHAVIAGFIDDTPSYSGPSLDSTDPIR